MEHATENNRKWRKNNKEKQHAHDLVWWEVRNGRLKKQPCQMCGNPKTHAHHEDYAKPLEVIWLCPQCHKNAHASETPEEKAERMVRYWKERHKKLYVKKDRKKKHNLLKDKAKEMRVNGATYTEIAKEFSISKGTAYKWVNTTPYN